MPDKDDPRSPSIGPVRVWDLPTRVFHWLLAATIVSSIVSAHLEALNWHFRFGYLAFGLLLFRICWGFVGGRWSRFASFAYAPGTVLRYLRGGSRSDEHHDVGHNPLGAFSVFALLALLVLQVATGLVADDEVSTTGPLNQFVSNATGLKATAWHHDVGQWILIALVVLHVAAILFYRFRKDIDLVRPMVSGDKLLPAGTPAAADSKATRTMAVVLAAVVAAIVAYVASFG